MNKNGLVIGIDPGELVSGVCIIDKKKIRSGMIIDNSKLVASIKKIPMGRRVIVVLEDIVNPYQGMKKQTIATCKFIGVLQYLLSLAPNITMVAFERYKVKLWVYNKFPKIAVARVKERIEYLDAQGERLNRKRYRNDDGELRKPSFVYVDDRIVQAAMRKRYNVPVPKPGKENIYGLKSHSWQALAVATMFIDSRLR